MLDLLWPSLCCGCGARGQGRLCPSCLPSTPHRVGVDLPGIQGALALAGYDSGLARALRQAKYGSDRHLAVQLARGMAQGMGPTLRLSPPDLVIAAPSPWTRRLGRGFSVPQLLAHHLARALGCPWVDALRLSPGPRQARLSASRRRAALAGRVRSVRPVRGRVLLVDDVLTTGATASACAGELLGSGADEVWVAVLCAARKHAR